MEKINSHELKQSLSQLLAIESLFSEHQVGRHVHVAIAYIATVETKPPL